MKPLLSIEDRVKKCLAKHPEWDSKRVAKSAGAPLAMVGDMRNGESPQAEPKAANSTPPSGGFSLRGVLLLSKKPADCMKARLYGLRRGMGYKIEDLSKQWGVSTDTLRKHAKDHHALVYVEATPGEFVACIVHPETPKEG